MDEQSSGHQDGRVLIRRFASLFVGLWLYGFSMAMMITAGLGLDPWDVFHQGVAEHVSLSFGVITAITGAGGTAALDSDPSAAGIRNGRQCRCNCHLGGYLTGLLAGL